MDKKLGQENRAIVERTVTVIDSTVSVPCL